MSGPRDQENELAEPSSLPEEEDKDGKKRKVSKVYLCKHCGLPKKGHTCEKELRGNLCSKCGQPKKGHDCPMLPPNERKKRQRKRSHHQRIGRARPDSLCPKFGGSREEYDCENEAGARMWQLLTHDDSEATNSFDPSLAWFAFCNSSRYDCSLYGNVSPFKSFNIDTTSCFSETFRDWLTVRNGKISTCLPPSLLVKTEGATHSENETISENEVVVSPYDSACPSPSKSALYLNAAGPVWGLAFAPQWGHNLPCQKGNQCHHNLQPHNKYLAIGTSRIGWLSAQEGLTDGLFRHGVGTDFFHELDGQSKLAPNLMQIWKVQVNCRVMENCDNLAPSNAEISDAKLLYLLHIESSSNSTTAVPGNCDTDSHKIDCHPHWKVDSFIDGANISIQFLFVS